MFNDNTYDYNEYTSPVEIKLSNTHSEFIAQVEDAVMIEIEKQVGVHVDKDELTKALKYDRDQYHKGYQDGFARGSQDAKEQFIKELRQFIGLKERE